VVEAKGRVKERDLALGAEERGKSGGRVSRVTGLGASASEAGGNEFRERVMILFH